MLPLYTPGGTGEEGLPGADEGCGLAASAVVVTDGSVGTCRLAGAVDGGTTALNTFRPPTLLLGMPALGGTNQQGAPLPAKAAFRVSKLKVPVGRRGEMV